MMAFRSVLSYAPLLRSRTLVSYKGLSNNLQPSLRTSLQTSGPVFGGCSFHSFSRTHQSPVIRDLVKRRFFRSSSKVSIRSYYPRNDAPPPRSQFLGFLDRIPHNRVFYGILGANIVVFVMWHMATSKYKYERDSSSVRWMMNNFLNSWDNLASGRLWTPLTACFSHGDIGHIFFNCFTYYFTARPVVEMLGSRQFLFLYAGAGMFSSFSSLIYARITGKKDFASRGASGAIYSIVSFLACVAPKMTFQLYGIIPVPAWLLVTGLFSYDLYRTVKKEQGTTDTVGHLGGMLAGGLYLLARRRFG